MSTSQKNDKPVVNPFKLSDQELRDASNAAYETPPEFPPEPTPEESIEDPAAAFIEVAEDAVSEDGVPKIPDELDGKVIPFYKAESGITTPDTYFIYGMTIGVFVGALLLYTFHSKLLLCAATFLGMLIGYLIKKPETPEPASQDENETAPSDDKEDPQA